MKAQSEKTVAKQSKAVAGASPARQLKQGSEAQFEDRRPEAVDQRVLAGKADSNPQARRIAQLQAMADSSAAGTVQRLGLDEEEPLQGKFETIQKQEEEEELQMKSETIQRQGPEEEELLQGKFETVQRQGAEEEEDLLQGKFETIQRQGAEEEEELLQGKFATVQKQGLEEEEIQAKSATLQRKAEQPANNTGLPDNLKSGIENLSGLSLDDVKVHYNSPKPAQLKAHAFAQGTDIHMAPGQEKHLPHEAWHVVQQKQGRVKPTKQLKGKVNVNDDAGLEKEADVMGVKVTLATEEMQDSRPGPISRLRKKNSYESTFQFFDNRPEAIAQRKLKGKVTSSLKPIQLRALQEITRAAAECPTARGSTTHAQSGLFAAITTSPRVVAPRAPLNAAFGPSVPRQNEPQAVAAGPPVQRKLSGSEDVQERAGYSGGKFRKGTWSKLVEALDAYNKLDPYDDKTKEQRIERLQQVMALTRTWLGKHGKEEKLAKAHQVLNEVYHEAATELLDLRSPGENFVGGGYVGDLPTLVHPPSKRSEVAEHKKLGSQGYKLHISYANFPDNVDRVISKVLPALKGKSRKIVHNPAGLTGGQENKFMAVYPALTEVTHDKVKLREGATKTVKVTYFEADRKEAEEMAELCADILKKADVVPGGAVPDEEKLNNWTYTRYGSFTGKTVYEVKDGVLEEKSDLGRK